MDLSSDLKEVGRRRGRGAGGERGVEVKDDGDEHSAAAPEHSPIPPSVRGGVCLH